MKLVFILSMPGCASWNGQWSGEGKLYCIIRGFTGKRGIEKASNILKKGYYSYNFGDGWRAGIQVKKVEGSQELATLRRKTEGFCGYDWMVDSIIQDGAIYGPTQPKPNTLDSVNPIR